MKRVLALAAVLAPALSFADTSAWSIDPAHSHASFTIRHLVISNVRGEFTKLSGSARLDEKDLARSSVETIVDAGTIDTRVPDRDNHLRSPDFLDVAKYPSITFKSTKVEKAGQGAFKVSGDLTLHGVTRPVVLDVTGPTAEVKDPSGKVRRGISASTKINRKDFGLGWNKLVEAGPVVGDEVKIEIEAELIKQPAEKLAPQPAAAR
jgi:polyisoprenoid-binding protein YceI